MSNKAGSVQNSEIQSFVELDARTVRVQQSQTFFTFVTKHNIGAFKSFHLREISYSIHLILYTVTRADHDRHHLLYARLEKSALLFIILALLILIFV